MARGCTGHALTLEQRNADGSEETSLSARLTPAGIVVLMRAFRGMFEDAILLDAPCSRRAIRRT